MIRLIQRRLIVPRGDTGTFSIPVLAGKDSGDTSIFTIFSPLTHRKIFEKVMENSNGVLKMDLTHGDTVNLPVGEYVWDIKFYTDPVFVDEKLVSGTEVDSYYSAFQLPVCEIRETGDNLLMADDAPDSKLAPEQINYIDAAIIEIHESRDAAISSAAEADTSATNAETSASNAAASAQTAQDSEDAAVAAKLATQAAASDAANSASMAAISANSASNSATAASNSATNAASSAAEAAASVSTVQAAQAAAESAQANAATQASNASASATAAANSASAASISQQAAAASATAALASQQASAASETNAMNSATAAAASAQQAAATAQAIHEEIPTKVSQLENDSGYLTQHQDISGKANIADLATVATSGSYNDLSNKPFIPSAISDLTDDSGHYTKPANGIPASDLEETYLTSFTETDPTVPSWAKAAQKPSYTAQEVGALPSNTYIPSKTSDLTNDSNYPVDANYVHTDNNYTTEEKSKLSGIAAGAEVNVNADWNAVSGDAAILNKPTNVSAFTNDVGYLTQHQDISGKANSADLATVATTGAYNDLSGTPTNVSSFTNDAGYLTQHQDISGKADISAIPTSVSQLTNDAGYLTSYTETDPTVPSWAKAAQKPTYTAAEVGAPTVSEMNSAIGTAIGNVHQFNVQVVQSLPTQDIQEHTVYFVPKIGETNDVYDEYIYVNSNWEMIGNTQIDLSNYVQKTDYATNSNAGVVKVANVYGINISPTGFLSMVAANNQDIQNASGAFKAITPRYQSASIFYGLAQAAGDTTQASSSNAVGIYTDEAKAAILNMFGLQLATDTEIQNIINGGAGA